MPLWRWPDLPAPVKDQIDRFGAEVAALLGEDFVGLYLHGSLAMGCPNPAPSDIDVIAVGRRPLTPTGREALAGLLMRASGAPRPLEFHLLTAEQIRPWRHPAPFDFHFSESWRERFERRAWPQGDGVDRDLAAHLTILHHAGAVLAGPPVAEIFPAVPREDYVDALLYDYGDCVAQMEKTPVYSLLNLCRIYGYLRDRLILSKEEGGQWGLAHLPEEYQAVLRQALEEYRGGERRPFDPEVLQSFRSFMVELRG